MLTETSHRNMRVAKIALMVVALAFALSATARLNLAQAADDISGNQLSAAACSRALPALENTGFSAQTGHLQALKVLEACDIRLGLKEKADFTRWQINEDLERGHPSDE
jgi:hypothetical protein